MRHPALRWIFGFLTIVLCRSIAAQLPVQSSDPVASIAPAHFESESPSQYQLLQTQQTLEEAILNAEITFNAWDSRLSETMLSLAKVRTALGYTQQARLTYFHVLHNIRVNRGLYSVDQLPIILDLMQWYLADKEYQIAGELGDWAAFLYRRIYPEKDQVLELVSGYQSIISLRVSAPRTHECFSRRRWFYKDNSYPCRRIRRARADHFASAVKLQKRAVALLEENFGDQDPRLRDQLVSLSNLSLRTAGVVRGVDFGGSPRQRYMSGYYFRTSLRTLKQLREDFQYQ